MKTSAGGHGARVIGGARDAAERAPKHRFFVLVVIALLVAVAVLVMQWASSTEAPTADVAPPTTQNGEPAALARSGGAVAEARSAAVPDGAKPSSPSPSLARGTVVVDVYREPAIAVAGVRVLVGNEAAVTDANGRAVVRIGAGRWLVAVDEKALAPELLPPCDQFREEPGDHPPGFFARRAVVTADATTIVKLRVFMATSLTGVVVDRDGTPVPDCGVTLSSRAWRSYATANAITDLRGLYRFQDVRPGNYQLHAYAGPPHAAQIPLRVDIAEGERGTLPTLVIDGGTGIVRGRVVDQDGEPVEGVPVVLYPTEESAPDGNRPFDLGSVICVVPTDRHGQFLASRLPTARLTVQVHPEGALHQKGEANPLTAPPKPVVVDLRERSEQFVDVAVVRSRPFTLAITVIDDEARIRAADPTLPKKLRASDVFVVKESERNDPTKRQKLDPDRDGRVSWKCETPHEAVWVIVKRRGFAVKEERVEPAPLQNRALEIRYP